MTDLPPTLDPPASRPPREDAPPAVRRLMWKEARTLAGPLLLVCGAVLLVGLGVHFLTRTGTGPVLAAAAVCLYLWPIAVGAVQTAGEAESATDRWLRSLAIDPRAVRRAKAAVGFAASLLGTAAAVGTLLLVIWLRPDPLQVAAAWWTPLAVPVLVAGLYGVGAAAGVATRRVVPAVLGGAAVAGLAGVACRWTGHEVAAQVTASVAAAAVGWRALRMQRSPGVTRGGWGVSALARRSASVLPGTPAGRAGRSLLFRELAAALPFAAAAGLTAAAAAATPLFWPAAVGVFAAWAAAGFLAGGLDRRGGTLAALTDRGVSPTAVWSAKTGVWFAAASSVAALGLVADGAAHGLAGGPIPMADGSGVIASFATFAENAHADLMSDAGPVAAGSVRGAVLTLVAAGAAVFLTTQVFAAAFRVRVAAGFAGLLAVAFWPAWGVLHLRYDTPPWAAWAVPLATLAWAAWRHTGRARPPRVILTAGGLAAAAITTGVLVPAARVAAVPNTPLGLAAALASAEAELAAARPIRLSASLPNPNLWQPPFLTDGLPEAVTRDELLAHYAASDAFAETVRRRSRAIRGLAADPTRPAPAEWSLLEAAAELQLWAAAVAWSRGENEAGWRRWQEALSLLENLRSDFGQPFVGRLPRRLADAAAARLAESPPPRWVRDEVWPTLDTVAQTERILRGQRLAAARALAAAPPGTVGPRDDAGRPDGGPLADAVDRLLGTRAAAAKANRLAAALAAHAAGGWTSSMGHTLAAVRLSRPEIERLLTVHGGADDMSNRLWYGRAVRGGQIAREVERLAALPRLDALLNPPPAPPARKDSAFLLDPFNPPPWLPGGLDLDTKPLPQAEADR